MWTSASNTMADESSLTSLGKYQVLGPIGRGSMGVVYKARDPEIGRIVAIKTLRKILLGDANDADAAVRRFKFEARSAGNLRHSNIITIFDVSREGETPFIVMDYVEGNTLEAILENKRRLDPVVMFRYLSQIASGLDYAHSRGVIHRDIKPSNILIDRSENSFILDFGIAQINESFPGQEEGLTSSKILGTPGYMSPEQILNEKLDNQTDLFSLAIVAFECLTGQRPFPGDNFTTVIGNIVNSKPLSLTALCPDLPLSLEAEFERALAKNRKERYDSAEHMMRCLGGAVGLKLDSGGSFPQNVRAPVLTKTAPGEDILSKNSEFHRLEKRGPSVNFSSSTGKKEEKTAQIASPWKMLSGAGGNMNWDIGADQTDRGVTPGALFEHEKDSIKGVQFVQFRSLRLRRLTAAMGFVCVILGCFIIISNYRPDLFGFAGQTISVPSKPGDLIRKPPKASIARPNIIDMPEGLAVPLVDPVPPGKGVHELTDRQLLGVLVDVNFPEEMVVSALREAKERMLPGLVEANVITLRSPNTAVRLESVKLLGQLKDRRIVPNLLELLGDSDLSVRRATVQTLIELGDRSSVSYLTVRYSQENNVELKGFIARAIEKISGVPFAGSRKP